MLGDSVYKPKSKNFDQTQNCLRDRLKVTPLKGGKGQIFFEKHDGTMAGGGGSKPKNRQIINDVIYGWSLMKP